MKQKNRKFWMVYGDSMGRPTFKHPSKTAAQMEAKRLACAHPGICFFVLACVDGYEAARPEPSAIKIEKPSSGTGISHDSDDDIPF